MTQAGSPTTYNLHSHGVVPSGTVPQTPIFAGNFGANLGYLVQRRVPVTPVNRKLYRVGYYAYDPLWLDSQFSYNGYVFDPFQVDCYYSPLYFYSCLPGYLPAPEVVIVSPEDLPTQLSGTEYTWNRPQDPSQPGSGSDGNPNANPVLDSALFELTKAFETQDEAALSDLVGRKENVNIYIDGRYAYSLSSDNYFDLMRDAVRIVKTTRYEILDVQYYRNEAKVLARHTYEDPWGKPEVVYHTYRLLLDNKRSRVTEFGTSDTRPY